MYILILNKEGHMFATDHITTDIDIATKFESEFDAMEIVAVLQHAYPEWELKKI